METTLPIDIAEDSKPQPLQGKMQWYRDFYGEIKYPATARENGIQGVVELESHINAFGKVNQGRSQNFLVREL